MYERCFKSKTKSREISEIIDFWNSSFHDNKYYQENEKYGYKGKEIKVIFEEADKKIPNISTSYKKDPDAILYISRLFTFDNLTKPVNSSIISSYLEDEKNNEDSQLVDLEVSSLLLQSEEILQGEFNNIKKSGPGSGVDRRGITGDFLQIKPDPNDWQSGIRLHFSANYTIMRIYNKSNKQILGF
ncbi:hypothetical protein C1646_662419 [Rhizophagus diaphanus]|nr:hypothetical protein C1646_662419 [Rhizophagus diaphanus] [Rhizophagus sp. MUCL 43196]